MRFDCRGESISCIKSRRLHHSGTEHPNLTFYSACFLKCSELESVRVAICTLNHGTAEFSINSTKYLRRWLCTRSFPLNSASNILTLTFGRNNCTQWPTVWCLRTTPSFGHSYHIQTYISFLL